MTIGEGDYIKFLGTAGSRFVVAGQTRKSGGVFINYQETRVLIDPGPGALVGCVESGIDVSDIDAVILTHSHIDHSNDVNIVVDAMTRGGWSKRGGLFAPRDCLEGKNSVVLNYLRPFLQSITVFEPKKDYTIGSLEFSTSIRHLHAVETYGLKFRLGGKRVYFMVDSGYFPELAQNYTDADTLIMNLTLEDRYESETIKHLCVEDAVSLIAEIRPRKTVLTHFGTKMLDKGPNEIARIISEKTGAEVIAAEDGMVLTL